MALGYAIIQLPELVLSFYRFIKIKIIENHEFLSPKSASSTKTKKLEMMKPANIISSIKPKTSSDGYLFTPCKDRTCEDRLLQLELQFTSILEREDELKLKLDNQEKKFEEKLALMHTK